MLRFCKSMKPFPSLLCGLVVGFLLSNYAQYVFLGDGKCSIRRRYLHDLQNDTSIKPKKLLFIGVMTADKYGNTRAMAIQKTWGAELGADVVFFSSENSSSVDSVPLVKLKGVDDVYPPQKKSFMMLQYMYDNLVDQYEYFMRADDDLYVRVNFLKGFLRKLNSSDRLYIGQPGQGIPSEQGQLSLAGKENYCMGGPGMIFSHATLRKIGPNIPACYADMKTPHEDVEIGRCIQSFAGSPCTWSYDMRTIFHHLTGVEKQFTTKLRKTNIENAITLHPLKNPQMMFEMHSFSKQMETRNMEMNIVKNMRELKHLSQRLPPTPQEIIDDTQYGLFISHLGFDKTLDSGISREILPWNYLNESVFGPQEANPKHRPTSDLTQGITDVVRELMKELDRASNERGRALVFKKLLYGYQRLNDGVASQYIVDVLMLYRQYRGSKRTVDVRRHAYLQLPFGPLYVQVTGENNSGKNSQLGSLLQYLSSHSQAGKGESLQQAEDKTITFVMPLSGRLETFKRFIENYEEMVLKRKEKARLLIVHFVSSSEDDTNDEFVYKVTSRLQWQYGSFLEIIKTTDTFSRGEALVLGSSYCKTDELMFFVDVDILFTSDALRRIRWHTQLNRKVYFPIVFSEYDPHFIEPSIQTHKRDHFNVTENHGYWRKFGFGIAALYKEDFESIGGFNTSIKGWGGEDVDLFNKAVGHPELEIMRTRDPGLVHVYHPIHCDPNLPKTQYSMCKQSGYSTYASRLSLSLQIEKHRILT